MIRSYFLSAVRSFLRHKLSAVINIFGLSLGLCCALLIALYAIDEYSYDNFHEDAEKIYRFKSQFGIQNEAVPLGPYQLNDYMLENIPEIQSTVRLRPESGEDFWIKYEDNSFIEEDFILADSSFFSFFSFPLLKGHPDGVLREHNSLVVSESAAKKYFGDKDPVGEILYLLGKHPAMVTGVMKDFPANSHFDASIIANFEISRNYAPSFIFDNWGSLSCYYYLKLEDNADPDEVVNKIMLLLEDLIPEMVEFLTISVQPLSDIRLHSTNIAWDISSQGSITLLNSLITIAIVIILLASVNYINLYTAQSTKRKKEVGIRKVMGAQKRDIFWQSMTESFILVFISFFVALGLTEILLPYANDLSGKSLALITIFTLPYLFWLIVFLIVISLLSGFYPAMVLGKFMPADIFRSGSLTAALDSFWGKIINLRLRQILIVFQFCCAITLIILSFSINSQINYMFDADYGYESNGLILVNNPEDENQENRFYRIKNKLEQYTEVRLVASGENIPSNRHGNFTYIRMTEDDYEVQVGNMNVSHDYLAALESRVVSGRLFDREYRTDNTNIVINRTAARNLGYTPDEIINKEVMSHSSSQPLRIIGVVEDIHFFSLHEMVPPLMFNLFNQPSPFSNILIRTEPGDEERVIDIAGDLWQSEHTDYPFNYSYIEERHKNLYSREAQTRQLLNIFMLVAILISLLGLFALASFIMVSRIKEIAVRKIMGANHIQILRMLIKEFSMLVLISMILAWPVAWFTINRWLENFAYRQEVQYTYFIIAPVIALLAAWITISYHAYKTATINAAEALKYE